jgi:hypothetical protein
LYEKILSTDNAVLKPNNIEILRLDEKYRGKLLESIHNGMKKGNIPVAMAAPIRYNVCIL